MAREGLNTLTQQIAKDPDGTKMCEAGCMVFYGGERKHHRDCVHYPESLTKMWHDTEAGLQSEIDQLRDKLDMAMRRADSLADQMLQGKADGGLLGGRQLKRALPGIFGVKADE